MSDTAGWRTARPDARTSGKPKGIASAIAEREAGDSLLRFLTRLSAFGLAATPDPLLKPVKPAG